MSHGGLHRAKSPSHQQLYKAHGESASRGPTSTTPTPNSYSLSRMSNTPTPRNSHRLMPNGALSTPAKNKRLEDMVYVADVNPTFSVTAAVRCIAPVNDRIMWTAEYSGTLCIRALPKATPLKELPGREDSYCISLMYLPKEDVVWAGFQDGYLHVYSAKNMELLTETMAHSGGLSCMLEIEGSVFTGGANWRVCQWDPAKGNAQLKRVLYGHNGGVRSLDVFEGPTGAVLFSGSDDGTVRAWDPYDSASDQENPDSYIHVFTGHSRSVLALAVVSHVNQLWSAGEDLTVRVWDMRSLSCLAVLRGGHTAPIANLMVVESRVWSADKHGHILLWDITTRSLLQDLSKRVPYWGIQQGMVLAMQKVQPITAYKVWTASSNGVMQCWSAETVPIIFDDVPVSSGVVTDTNVRPTSSSAIPNGDDNGVAAAARPGSGPAGAAKSLALTVPSPRNSRLLDNNREEKVPTPAPMAQMQIYIRSLQEELEAAKRDARINYDKYRVEVQREIETQQLLAEENDRLRNRVRKLAERLGEPEERWNTAVPESRGIAPFRVDNDEVERLRSMLADTQQQLEQASERQRELEAELDQYKPESPTLRMSIITTPSACATRDPYRQLMRQDEAAKQLGTSAYASTENNIRTDSGTTTLEGRNHSDLLNALLPTTPQDDDGAIHAGVPVARTLLSRRFDGDNWGYIFQEKPHELRSTFIADCCAGLGVAPTQLEQLDLRLGSLVAEVSVVHPASVPAAELERRMSAYRFPALRQLHSDAFKAPKSVPDTASATIRDLQRQLDELMQTNFPVEVSPEPQHPSKARQSQSYGGDSDPERQWLKDQNDTLRDTLQRQIKLINDLKNEARDKQAQLATARSKLLDTEARLQDALGQNQVRIPADANGEVQKLREDHEALNDYLENQLKPMISRLKRARGELQFDNEALKKKVEELTSELQVHPSNGRHVVESSPHPYDDGEVQKLREDHEALNDYLENQLKPMISRLKRARGELQFDNEALKKKVEELTSELQVHPSNGRHVVESSPHPYDDGEVQKLREDHEALNDYLENQLKPMISRLKRARGELQLDVSRTQEELNRSYDICNEKAAALEEERVREEKMGEAMEALRKALEAAQLKNAGESDSGLPLSSWGAQQGTERLALPGAEVSTNAPGDSTAFVCNENGAMKSATVNNVGGDSVDKLVALNLDISVRLADAEMVIEQLQKSLKIAAERVATQRHEAHMEPEKAEEYRESGSRSPGPLIVSRSVSASEIVSSTSPSRSISKARE